MSVLTARMAVARLRNGVTTSASRYCRFVFSNAIAITSRFRAFASRREGAILNNRSGRFA
ncbi:hypothetical protein [Rhizobium sp. CECT 9324]|uniref:hypothetical protein n=1 Tax=Rhizobium sp. CECT 9324 TaxID=2845820 RepID=UPI001E5400BB|nr:hypothetical protein [Rhizobium sp. CECT 9324]